MRGFKQAGEFGGRQHRNVAVAFAAHDHNFLVVDYAFEDFVQSRGECSLIRFHASPQTQFTSGLRAQTVAEAVLRYAPQFVFGEAEHLVGDAEFF